MGVCKIREREVERKLRQATADRGGLCLKFISPGWAGAPDRVVVLPGGMMGFVEVKALGQTPRPLQLARHRQLATLGCVVATVDDPSRIEVVLDLIQNGKQRSADSGGEQHAGP